MNITLNESTEMRDARMWQRLLTKEDGFEMHVTLIMWKDRVDEPGARFIAWSEGPRKFSSRVDDFQIPAYHNKVAKLVDQRGF